MPKIAHKALITDDSGRVVGSREVHYDESDVARMARDQAVAMVRRCFTEADAAEPDDTDAVLDWLDRAQHWAYVALVADGKWPGQLDVNDAGTVTGVRMHSRPLLTIAVEPFAITARPTVPAPTN